MEKYKKKRFDFDLRNGVVSHYKVNREIIVSKNFNLFKVKLELLQMYNFIQSFVDYL